MNENIWNLKSIIDELSKADLLDTIEEKMETHVFLASHTPFYEVKLAYDNNKSMILELANEYITRYNELPVVSLGSKSHSWDKKKEDIDYPLKEIGQ